MDNNMFDVAYEAIEHEFDRFLSGNVSSSEVVGMFKMDKDLTETEAEAIIKALKDDCTLTQKEQRILAILNGET